MKVAVVGSRNFEDYSLVCSVLDEIKSIDLIISGGAKGADSLAEQYAKDCEIKTEIILPDWKQYGRGAGFVRNRQIVESCDCLVAFWDGKSKGTKNSISLAQKRNIEVKVVRSDF